MLGVKRVFGGSLRLGVFALPVVLAATSLPPGAGPVAAASPCPAGVTASELAVRAGLSDCPVAPGPESASDLMRATTALAARAGTPAEGARMAAAAQRANAAAQPRAAGNANTWQPAGKGPLIADDPRYGSVNGEGLKDLGGRINDFTYDPRDRTLYASVGQGGVWLSRNMGQSWFSIGESLPTQSIGGIGFSPAGSDLGTVIVTTGNDVFGGGTTFAGLGVFYTTDLGKTWTRASGVPDDIISFKIAVDPGNPNIVYAATGAGLFRSTDIGHSFVNVPLPVSPAGAVPNCNGAPTTKEGCYLANMVTDVIVRAPGGTGTDKTGGAVIAAVGWRAGNKTNVSKSYPNGYIEAPGDGLYYSPNPATTAFTRVGDGPFADSNKGKIGRIELGEAVGPTQDHGYLYAIVQDSTAFKGGAEAFGIDAPVSPVPGLATTYLMGVYSSPDFGATWTKMTDATALADPSSGSALTGTACGALQYCPGVQSWYNMWIKPDPTRADASGVPTRLVFGLEEVWENSGADAPVPVGAAGPTRFQVVGPYFSGKTCLFLNTGVPFCPTTAGFGGNSTTHPDQQGGIWVPDRDGKVSLVVGNDGGAYIQQLAAGAPLDIAGWDRGRNNGFNTLMPYSAAVSKDGTIFAGLQDNGELRIEPGTAKNLMTYGGDGTHSQVDPNNSKVAYERTPGGRIKQTSDGGQTWTTIGPSDTFAFVNPFAMDPADAGHLVDAGHKVWESNGGAFGSTPVFDLGTAKSGAANVMSWVDVRGVPIGQLPTGPHTPDFKWTAGATTVPGGMPNPTGVEVPGTYEDKAFTIAPTAGNAQVKIAIKWTNENFDWDLYLYKVEADKSMTLVSSATGSAPETSEQVVVSNPQPGNYIIRVENFAASGSVDGTATFTQRSVAGATTSDAIYVAFCGTCDALNARPFDNGIATNVGGDKPGARGTTDGWHFAKTVGLPKRYITSVVSDPGDAAIVYATLGGYSRRWERVGAMGEGGDVGSGHVFRSTDAGNTFTDISGDLPDTPAESVIVNNGKLIVATDVGVYIAGGTLGGHYDLLGNGLPTAPVLTVVAKPKAVATEPDSLVVATHGRSVYTYQFPGPRVTQPIPTKISFVTPPAGLPNTSLAKATGWLVLPLGLLLLALGVAGARRRSRSSL
ncbi:MAG: hypothetical protein NVSMB17_08560 [Candidatus Dormibacteria bacterium]